MADLPKTHRVWLLKTRPTDKAKANEFEFTTRDTPTIETLKDGEVLVKNTSFGNEPAQRLWMDGSIEPKRLYTRPILVGEAVRSMVIGNVVLSKSKNWKEGDEVYSEGDWAEYSVLMDSYPMGRKTIKLPDQSPYISNSILGLTGQTAYVGAFAELDLKPEHTLVVSGAAGAVGSTLIQIATKVMGIKNVVGIAGGKAKCDWVKSLGATECVDYKADSFREDLARALPNYADRFFDNVGGEILDIMLSLVVRHGKIIACGNISGYNDAGFNVSNWGEVVYNRLTIKGMLLLDHLDVMNKGVEEIAKWIEDGTIKNTEGETVVESKLEGVPEVYQRLFRGQNQGKLITKLVE